MGGHGQVHALYQRSYKILLCQPGSGSVNLALILEKLLGDVGAFCNLEQVRLTPDFRVPEEFISRVLGPYPAPIGGEGQSKNLQITLKKVRWLKEIRMGSGRMDSSER
jgi:hypothetical protein